MGSPSEQPRPPVLVHLNGPPGSGKSTLARAFVEEHPLALNLDLDVLRSMLGGWQTHLDGAGRRTRELALLLAGDHLRQGRDVVVPQYLGQVDFIVELERVACDAGASFFEVALLDECDAALTRFLQREHPEHTGSAGLSERGWHDMQDRLQALVAARPNSLVLRSIERDIAGTCAALTRMLRQ